MDVIIIHQCRTHVECVRATLRRRTLVQQLTKRFEYRAANYFNSNTQTKINEILVASQGKKRL